MLVNLIPDFLAAVSAPDPVEAYHRYLEDHRPIMSAYWHNYVIDLDSPHAQDVIRRMVRADRSDLYALLAHLDVEAAARETLDRCAETLQIDAPVDVYLMVGVGAANAGELVVGGRGIAFICLEHFTGRANPESHGLGLQPELMALWLGHEVAHAVRYTSPSSRSEIRALVEELGGFYDYWEIGSRSSLLELLVNEGLAVEAARLIAPGCEPWEYFGFQRRQYRRLRELDTFLRRVMAPELDRSGLGYRLRYLSGGMSPQARLVRGKVIPERAGYYVGHRLVEPYVATTGIAAALRASAAEIRPIEEGSGAQTA